MRVLLLHNRYRSQGGEERAVHDIATLLSARGHVVEVLERSSASVGRGTAARGMLLGGVESDEVGRAVRAMRADVVHAHNVHPLLGWRALSAARAAGARTVLHLHNFRLFCAIAIGYRDNEVCFRCHGRDTRSGLRLRCRGSLGESAVYAAGLRVQQPRLFQFVDAFVAVSGATLSRLHALGMLERASAVALSNFIFDQNVAVASGANHGEYAFVSGRLVPEKGFDTAIAAARIAGVPLIVAGEGPDEQRLRSLAAGGDVRFTGRLGTEALAAARAGAAVALVPSRWEEPCPYSVIDAMADGVPVLASDIGGLPELVGGNCLVPPGDASAWAEALAELWRDPELRQIRGSEALSHARERLGEDRYYARLMEVYAP